MLIHFVKSYEVMLKNKVKWKLSILLLLLSLCLLFLVLLLLSLQFDTLQVAYMIRHCGLLYLLSPFVVSFLDDRRPPRPGTRSVPWAAAAWGQPGRSGSHRPPPALVHRRWWRMYTPCSSGSNFMQWLLCWDSYMWSWMRTGGHRTVASRGVEFLVIGQVRGKEGSKVSWS